MTRTGLSPEYINDVKDGSWPEAEPLIKTRKVLWKKYTKRFPDAETTSTANAKPKSKSAK